jgi:hypothetical protein
MQIFEGLGVWGVRQFVRTPEKGLGVWGVRQFVRTPENVHIFKNVSRLSWIKYLGFLYTIL